MNDVGRLHVLTDTVLQTRFSAVELARLAIRGGADVIQFRQKDGATNQMIDTARQLKAVCAGAGVDLIINDRIDVAMAIDADGVHLGQDDFPINKARRMLGPGMIIGGSADSLEEALQCQAEGADYVGFGPVFSTTSKDDAGPVAGLAALARVAAELRIPVVAIGGVNAGNAAQIMAAGAHGLAVISAVCCQLDPEAATAQLLRAMGLAAAPAAAAQKG